MNEPSTAGLPDGFRRLQQFHEAAGRELRRLDARHALWMEPDSLRNNLLVSDRRDTPFPDPNSVYEPHLYPYMLHPENNVEAWTEALRATFRSMVEEAEASGSALYVGEWGTRPSSAEAFPYVRAVQRASDEVLAGQAFWVWKECSQGFWGFYDFDAGCTPAGERTDGMREVGTPHASAVPGALLEHSFDPDTRVLKVRFRASGGEGPPLLRLPALWYPAGARILRGGLVAATGTGSVQLPWEGGAGEFEIEVRPAGGQDEG